MLAFGDSVLFLVVFGVAAVPATAAALYFLRPYPTLWRVLAGSALALGATGVAALLVYLADQTAAPGSTIQLLGGLALLRTIVAPLFALTFLLSGALRAGPPGADRAVRGHHGRGAGVRRRTPAVAAAASGVLSRRARDLGDGRLAGRAFPAPRSACSSFRVSPARASPLGSPTESAKPKRA
jgi:hypothetical protein